MLLIKVASYDPCIELRDEWGLLIQYTSGHHIHAKFK